MKHSLFNWIEISHAPILQARQLAEKNTHPLPVKTIKSQQYGWRQLFELCGDCFIRY